MKWSPDTTELCLLLLYLMEFSLYRDVDSAGMVILATCRAKLLVSGDNLGGFLGRGGVATPNHTITIPNMTFTPTILPNINKHYLTRSLVVMLILFLRFYKVLIIKCMFQVQTIYSEA